MGQKLSRAECNVPTRMLINVDGARAILNNCVMHRVAFMWGFLCVIELALIFGYFYTKDHTTNAFHIPAWILCVPILFGLFYALSAHASLTGEMDNEELELKLSGMSHKEYLNYKIGDDRATRSLTGTAMSAGILASSNVLGPFLRADR